MPKIDFDKLPFNEAIDAMRDRVVLKPEQFARLETDGRSRAFTAAWIDSFDVLSQMHAAMVEAIEEGLTFRDFARRVPTTLTAKGWRSPNPWHAQLVFNNAARQALHAGAYRQMVEADADSWIFRNLNDACPICRPLDGKRFRMNDRRFWPPVHHNCDCEPVIAFEDEGVPMSDGDQVFRQNVEHSDAQVADAYRKTFVETASPFRWDPAAYANVEPPDFTRYPPSLRALFEKKFQEIAQRN